MEKLSDLEPGMVLEGVVTNVTNFGAFVDIGVHRDGTVHISALGEVRQGSYEVVKAGDIVRSRSWKWTSHATASACPCA